jgi:hypothetical protein
MRQHGGNDWTKHVGQKKGNHEWNKEVKRKRVI